MRYVQLPGSPEVGTSLSSFGSPTSNSNGNGSNSTSSAAVLGLPASFSSPIGDLTRRRPRPFVTVVVIASAGLLVLLACVSFGVDTTVLGTDLSAQLSQLSRRPSFLSSHSSTSTSSQLATFKSWDYYSKYGSLQLDRKNKRLSQHEKARFVPVEIQERIVTDQEQHKGAKSSSKNRVNVLDPEVRLEDGFDELVNYHKAVKGDIEAAKALSYLNGKTVLLIGDSVDRFANDFLCEKLLPNSTLSYRYMHKDAGSLAKIEKPDMYHDYFAEPHLCEVSGSDGEDTLFNFKIYSLLFYGVTGEEQEWRFKDQTREPRVYDGKIKMFKEALDGVGLAKPDLIITHSILWDLGLANTRDARAEAPHIEALDLSFVEEFKDKTVALMDLLNELWPETHKMYRLCHNVRETVGDWFMRGLPGNLAKIQRVPMAAVKVIQLNQVVLDILENQGKYLKPSKYAFLPFNIRHVTQEYIGDFGDAIHLRETGLTLYTQMLFYYLKNFAR